MFFFAELIPVIVTNPPSELSRKINLPFPRDDEIREDGKLRFIIGLQSELTFYLATRDSQKLLANALVKDSASPRPEPVLDTTSRRQLEWQQRMLAHLPKVMKASSACLRARNLRALI